LFTVILPHWVSLRPLNLPSSFLPMGFVVFIYFFWNGIPLEYTISFSIIHVSVQMSLLRKIFTDLFQLNNWSLNFLSYFYFYNIYFWIKFVYCHFVESVVYGSWGLNYFLTSIPPE
jgi:hypothetical protein